MGAGGFCRGARPGGGLEPRDGGHFRHVFAAKPAGLAGRPACAPPGASCRRRRVWPARRGVLWPRPLSPGRSHMRHCPCRYVGSVRRSPLSGAAERLPHRIGDAGRPPGSPDRGRTQLRPSDSAWTAGHCASAGHTDRLDDARICTTAGIVACFCPPQRLSPPRGLGRRLPEPPVHIYDEAETALATEVKKSASLNCPELVLYIHSMAL